jgi:hypothetical protein
MARQVYIFTKSILERVSFDTKLFYKELNKAMNYLLPYEIEMLMIWLDNYTKNKPELQEIVQRLH